MMEMQCRQLMIAEAVTIKFVNAWCHIVQTNIQIAFRALK